MRKLFSNKSQIESENRENEPKIWINCGEEYAQIMLVVKELKQNKLELIYYRPQHLFYEALITS